MKKILTYCLALSLMGGYFTSYAQNQRLVQNKVTTLSETGVTNEHVSPFKVAPQLKSIAKLPNELQEAVLMQYDESSILELARRSTEFIEMEVPNTQGSSWTLLLEKVDFFHENFVINTSVPINSEVERGFHYRGKIKGQENSLVTVSVFDGSIQAIISDDKSNYNLGIVESTIKSKQKAYVLYPENQLNHLKGKYCSTPDLPAGVNISVNKEPQSGMKSSANCVSVYLEVDYDVFQNKGSVQNATNFMTAVFNEISTLYANESVNLKLGEMFVWNSPSPYGGSSSSDYLNDFRAHRTSYNGDLAHLVSMKSSYGGVAYVDVLCVPNYAYGWSGIQAGYEQVPTYSWTVEVITHELGHNLGSPHTQSCSWPGGAIDDCYTPEGVCTPGPTPQNGGTIMSYCHLTSTGINFNNGFGPLPGDLIRNEVAGASCLSTCEPVDPVCSVPSGVAASNVGQNGFDVAWNSVSTALSYGVRYRATGSSSWINSTVPQNNTTITGLVPDTQYEIQVRSNCDGEESAYSASLNVTTQTDQLVYCNSTSTNNQYEWIAGVAVGSFSKSSGGAGYSDFTASVIDITVGEATAIQLTPGFASSSYNEHWMLWADLNHDGDFSDAGEQLFSSGLQNATVNGSITIPSSALIGETRLRVSMKYNGAPTACETYTYGEVEDYTLNIQPDIVLPCDAPTALSVVATSLTDIMIDWQAAGSNETGYVVNYRMAGASSWSSANVSQTSYTLSGLSPSEDYEFRVKANCGSDESAFSGVISASTDDAPPCGSVSGSVSGISFDAATLNWSSSANANDYTLQYGEVGGALTSVQKSGLSHSLSGLQPATQYRFKVKANCQYGESAYSAEVVFTTADAPACASPSSLASSSITHTSATVSWAGVSGANSYVLETRQVGGSFSAASVSGTSQALSGLAASTNYEFRVKSVCDFGESAFSAIASFTTEDAPVNVNYCSAGGNNSSDEWIEKFTMGGTTYTSGNNGGYADFTAYNINLTIGQQSAVNFEPGFRSGFFGVTRYNEYWKVYLDINHDGDFDDAGELVFDAGGVSKYAVSGNLTVPSNATPGETRVRIMMKYNGASTSCETYSYGETEDFTAVLSHSMVANDEVLTASTSFSTLSLSDAILAPNPTVNGLSTLKLSFADGVESADVQVFDATGRIIATDKLMADADNKAESKINVQEMVKGTYIIQVNFSDGSQTVKRLIH